MKKQLTGVGFSILIIAAAAFIAFTPQQEKNKQHEKKQNQGQAKKEVKSNNGKKDVKQNRGNNGDKGNLDNDNRNNNGNTKDRDYNDKKVEKMNKENRVGEYGYDWDRETFKDRKKFRNQDKVTVCHKFNSKNDPAVAIRVSSNALKAHMNHGDVMGNCPDIRNDRYSDRFLRRRTDYYNDLQESQEQVLYSQSILDYARARLVNARTQLATYQNNNMPARDIEQRQGAVVELEQNVSLLETLIGVATSLLVSKFQ